MYNIAILASNKGTSSQGIIEEIENGKLRVNLTCVISNKEDAYALERAHDHGIESIFVDPKGRSREEYDRDIAEILKEKKVDLIVLVGYMLIMSPWFVQKYRNRIINVHPSLLPSFPGIDLDVHKEIIDYGCKVTGCTIHIVDERKDTGPIILQKTVEVADDEIPETLKPKVQALEIKWYPEVIRWFAEDRIFVEGRKVRVKK